MVLHLCHLTEGPLSELVNNLEPISNMVSDLQKHIITILIVKPIVKSGGRLMRCPIDIDPIHMR